MNKTGYKNPPTQHQFQKGQSGNPKGRPKKNASPSLQSILLKELQSQMSIQENGKEKTLSKQEIFIKSLISKALKGDKSSSQILIKLMIQVLTPEEELITEELSSEDQKILNRYLPNLKEESKKARDPQ